MTEAVLDIKHWGNSLGVRLPAALVRKAHLHAGQRVRITVKEGRVVIDSMKNERLSLEQRLAQFDPARHGNEAMTASPIGAENGSQAAQRLGFRPAYR